LCEQISVRDKQNASWLKTAKELSEVVHHHLKEEEKKFFQLAGKLLTESQKVSLARRYLNDVARMRKKLQAP
jgi:oligoendopeptidase F